MQDTLFTGHRFWPSTAIFMEELCFVVPSSISLWIRLCVSLGEFIFPVSLFIASRTSSELSDERRVGSGPVSVGHHGGLGG